MILILRWVLGILKTNQNKLPMHSAWLTCIKESKYTHLFDITILPYSMAVSHNGYFFIVIMWWYNKCHQLCITVKNDLTFYILHTFSFNFSVFIKTTQYHVQTMTSNSEQGIKGAQKNIAQILFVYFFFEFVALFIYLFVYLPFSFSHLQYVNEKCVFAINKYIQFAKLFVRTYVHLVCLPACHPSIYSYIQNEVYKIKHNILHRANGLIDYRI